MDRPGVCDDDALAALCLDLTTQVLQNGLQGDDIEPWFAQAPSSPTDGVRVDRDRALAGLGEALDSLATFVGAEDITAMSSTMSARSSPCCTTGTRPTSSTHLR